MNDKTIAINQELTKKETSIEYKEPLIRTYDHSGKTNTIKTLVPYFPLADKIIIKQVYEESIAVVRDEKAIRESEPKSTIVVAIGPNAFGIEIGDNVDVSVVSGVKAITFKNNNKSIRRMQDLLKEVKMNPIELNTRKVTMIEYFIVPLFSVNGIINE